jgi:hypothetical protein
MELPPEVQISDFLSLMRSYLAGEMAARDYQSQYFELMKNRMTITENEFLILQTAYLDADDYDPSVRLVHSIEETELKRRVEKSIHDLNELRSSA